MANPILEQIREILIPRLGEFITDSTLRVNCERIGTTPKKIIKLQLPELIKNLKLTLMLFLEEEEVEEVTQKILSIK
ncbi:hypothetical protein AMJ49_00420 [Parcubacteria bacterium DG_74_2]|nr:MAG: hypothetical protein AMJ49_00420 [Parcubacteria bacterium DG_74_2]